MYCMVLYNSLYLQQNKDHGHRKREISNAQRLS
jgi:hypothetical protein